jgi:hypothetical protein
VLRRHAASYMRSLRCSRCRIRARAFGADGADVTDDDVDRIAGKRDILCGKIQQRYGLTQSLQLRNLTSSPAKWTALA